MQYYGAKEGINERPIKGGGYNKDKVGVEVENFKEYNNQFYGYVQIKESDSVDQDERKAFNLKKIDPEIDEKLEEINNVLVIQIAPHPTEIGLRITGMQFVTNIRNLIMIDIKIMSL